MQGEDNSFEHPPHSKESCHFQYQSNLFFLIGDLIRIRFGSDHLNILFAFFIESNVRFDILFVFFIGLDVRFLFYLTSGLVFTIPSPSGLTSGLPFSSLRLIFSFIPSLK